MALELVEAITQKLATPKTYDPALLTLNTVNLFTMLATNGSGFVRRCGSTDLVGGHAALCRNLPPAPALQ